ncbi:MAG: hypothetical protein WBN40_08240, partial [Pseudomonadales bacterium]
AHADGHDFKLSEKLSVTGFIDMSFVYTDPDGGSSSQVFGLDQFEIDFLYTFDDKLTAQVDLEHQDDQDDTGGQETDVEQAFITYKFDDTFSLKGGRFLSYSGWETEEPTGLFQYSGTGYAKYFYGGYQQGVSGYYDGPGFDIAVSLVNDLGDLVGEGTDNQNIGTELMIAVNPVEGWTAKAFYMTEQDTDLINVWTSYAAAGWTFALEYNTSENAGAANTVAGGIDAEADGYLAMVNYAWDKFGITLRYHESEVEDSAGTTVEELSAITFAPSYAVTDNLLIVTEYRMDEDELTKVDTDSFAVEALLTF